jgi:hypothetical protein
VNSLIERLVDCTAIESVMDAFPFVFSLNTGLLECGTLTHDSCFIESNMHVYDNSHAHNDGLTRVDRDGMRRQIQRTERCKNWTIKANQHLAGGPSECFEFLNVECKERDDLEMRMIEDRAMFSTN